jgi:hypothetical protein
MSKISAMKNNIKALNRKLKIPPIFQDKLKFFIALSLNSLFPLISGKFDMIDIEFIATNQKRPKRKPSILNKINANIGVSDI